MEEQNERKIIQINILQTSMTLGTYLGVYMILVYAFMALSVRYTALTLISMPLMLGIPVIAFFLIKRFRDANCMPFFPFPISWMLTILMFLFATMLSCMAAYLYLRFIDKGAFFCSIHGAYEFIHTRSGVCDIGHDGSRTDRTVQLHIGNVQADHHLDLLAQSVRHDQAVAAVITHVGQHTVTYNSNHYSKKN